MKRSRFGKHWHGWFYDETYRANVDIIWPVNADQVNAFIKHRYDLEGEEGDTFGAICIEVVEDNGRQSQLICLRDWPKKPDAVDHSFLAHECLHAVINVLTLRGMKLENRVSSEAYTFLLESFIRRSLELMDTRRKV